MANGFNDWVVLALICGLLVSCILWLNPGFANLG